MYTWVRPLMLCAFDPLPEMLEYGNLTMQAALMREFYAGTSESFIGSISRQNTISLRDDICEWIGVHCIRGAVVGLWYASCDVGNFNIACAPPTVLRLSIHAAMQNYELDTRTLPRDVRHAMFSQNKIFGVLNLQGLPQRIEDFNISSNKLRGTVSFVDLPPNLRTMDLSGNGFSQDVVYYMNLPQRLESVLLARTKIKTVQPVLEGDHVPSAKIFPDIKRKDIQ